MFSYMPITPKDFLDAAVIASVGEADAELFPVYTETTGFLWVTEKGKIGGHNMIDIFADHEGENGALVIQTTPIDLMKLAES